LRPSTGCFVLVVVQCHSIAGELVIVSTVKCIVSCFGRIVLIVWIIVPVLSIVAGCLGGKFASLVSRAVVRYLRCVISGVVIFVEAQQSIESSVAGPVIFQQQVSAIVCFTIQQSAKFFGVVGVILC
jgi:hypothetical protein